MTRTDIKGAPHTLTHAFPVPFFIKSGEHHAGSLAYFSVKYSTVALFLSVPYRLNTLRTSSKSRQKVIHALTRVHVFMTLGYTTRHRQLGCRHTSRGVSSRLLTRGSSGAATCHVAPAPESWLRAARVLPHVPWRQLLLPSTGATLEQLRVP
jgi:hypothetical protein